MENDKDINKNNDLKEIFKQEQIPLPTNNHNHVLGEEFSSLHASKNYDPSNLPMIVWLRGDESFFSTFSWDAHKVMEVLGIKRSRLNQISGKELRVGKARIDKYIRPIFRPVDVEKYLEWTRPTASHKRSTGVLEEARRNLENKTQDLIELFTFSTEKIAKSFPYKLNQIFQRLTHFIFLQNNLLFKKIVTKIQSYHLEQSFLLKKINKKVSSTSQYEKNFIELISELKHLKEQSNKHIKKTDNLEQSIFFEIKKISQDIKNNSLLLENNQKNIHLIQKETEIIQKLIIKKDFSHFNKYQCKTYTIAPKSKTFDTLTKKTIHSPHQNFSLKSF